MPADGFYEWRKQGTRKQPYVIRLHDGEPMALAGLWERWTSHDGQDAIESFTIVVTEANDLLRLFPLGLGPRREVSRPRHQGASRATSACP